MKLISQIINELVDSNQSINGALLKTKVLASKIQNHELLEWVNSELNGYESVSKLPGYRKNIRTDIKGSFFVGNHLTGMMQYTNQPVPIIGLNEELQKSLQFLSFTESISSLEKLTSNDSKILSSSLNAELVSVIEDNWVKMGNPYLSLRTVTREISTNSVIEIISKVRNKLLDFMLEIDEQFGSNTEIDELKSKKEAVSTILNQTIINNKGDGNILNTGNDSKIKASITINKGNKNELEKHLLNAGIEKSDINELMNVIDTEKPNKENKTFGTEVNNWINKMFGKALNGSWNIAIGASGSLLAEAIGKYYGM